MVEKEFVDDLVGKRVWFLFKELNGRIFGYGGILVKVGNESIVIDFHGKKQVYALSEITKIQEDTKNCEEGE